MKCGFCHVAQMSPSLLSTRPFVSQDEMLKKKKKNGVLQNIFFLNQKPWNFGRRQTVCYIFLKSRGMLNIAGA